MQKVEVKEDKVPHHGLSPKNIKSLDTNYVPYMDELPIYIEISYIWNHELTQQNLDSNAIMLPKCSLWERCGMEWWYKTKCGAQ